MTNLKFIRLLWVIVLFLNGVIYVAASEDPEANTTDSYFVEISLNTKAEQIPNTSFAKNVRIYYRVNRTEIESDYMNNAITLEVLNQVFANNLLAEDDFIVITGSASPEGGFKNNQRLSEERALSLKNYIRQQYPEINDNQIIILPDGEDWDGLVDMIEKDSNVPNREQLLKILQSSLSRENQKNKIKKLDGGKPYAYLLTHILPYLRGSATGTIYSKKEQLVKTDTVEIFRFDTIVVEKEVIRIDTFCPVSQKSPSKFVMAVKSNLLYDAALLPNLAIEIPFGRNYNWSIGVEGNWSWWNTNADSYRYHRIQMAGVELRRWFGNKTGRPLTGWYVGAYAYGGTYDIRLFTSNKSDEGQLSDWSYSGGLTFGYSARIAKRFNLEFGLGFGYFGGEYHKYNADGCQDCVFPKLSTHDRNYWGPTKVGVSLVWLIGNFNQNKKTEEQR